MAANAVSRVALITGSTRERGIGLGVAKCLAKRGTAIVLHGTRDAKTEEVQKHVTELSKQFNVAVHYTQADLSTTDGASSLCQQVDQIYPDGIDILVNNAGNQHISLVEDFPLDKWDTLITTMLTTPFMLTKHFVPAMKKKGWGRIINISSRLGMNAVKFKSAYCSAKHGMLGLTKVVGLETAGTGVTCNAICPGWVATDIYWMQVDKRMKEKGISKEAAEAEIMNNPSKELVTPEQIGETVNFLCSPAADNITSTSIPIDGGLSA
ncbi:D-beta-hydroxybutyrate dehydrogenase-like [Amphiura filiformis]|uniref:D-beta-hydroxybutyrate dehydrogenase-like n=1 Tax=Amphiura filiformis TaxID=82378 RepID=UPI003B20C0A3